MLTTTNKILQNVGTDLGHQGIIDDIQTDQLLRIDNTENLPTFKL